MKKIFLITFSFLLILTACRNHDYEARVNSLDSMRTELADIRSEFLRIDTSQMKNTYDTIARYLKVLKENLTDTINRDEAELMSRYHSIRKPFNNFPVSYRMIKDELEYTESQLNDLARSLEQGKVPKDKVEEYYNLEMNSAQRLHVIVSDKTDQMRNLNRSFDSLHPLILNYLNRPQPDL